MVAVGSDRSILQSQFHFGAGSPRQPPRPLKCVPVERERLAFDIWLYCVEVPVKLEASAGNAVRPGNQQLRPKLQQTPRRLKDRRGCSAGAKRVVAQDGGALAGMHHKAGTPIGKFDRIAIRHRRAAMATIRHRC